MGFRELWFACKKFGVYGLIIVHGRAVLGATYSCKLPHRRSTFWQISADTCAANICGRPRILRTPSCEHCFKEVCWRKLLPLLARMSLTRAAPLMKLDVSRFAGSRTSKGPKVPIWRILTQTIRKLLLQKPYFVPYRYFGPFANRMWEPSAYGHRIIL